MNEETVGSLFEYPYNSYLMIRLEFVLLTQDELQAKIMRIIEVEMLKLKASWQRECLEAIEKKQTPPEEPEEYWVTFSQGLFLAFLYKYDTSTMGAKHPNSLSKTSLRRAFTELIDINQFIQVRAKPGDEFGPPQYTLNRKLIQDKMRKLPEHPMRLFLQGVSKKESGSFQIANSPTFQKGKSPVSKKESGEFPNCDPLNNSNLESNLDNKITSKDQSNTSANIDAASAANTPSSPQEKEPTPPTVTETSTVAPVVEAPTPSEPVEVKPTTTRGRTPRPPKPDVEKPAPAPLVMPAPDAKWNAETAVQIVEFSKKRHYSETTRKQELAEAKKVIDTEYEGGKIRREQFEKAWNEMVSWSFWDEKKIAPMIKHLHKDDKIVSILDGLKPKNGNGKKTSQQPTEQSTTPQPAKTTMTEEQAKRLAAKAIEDAKSKGHEIEATPTLVNGVWRTTVLWNTRHFERPMDIVSENHWTQKFSEMANLWDKNQKKEAIYG